MEGQVGELHEVWRIQQSTKMALVLEEGVASEGICWAASFSWAAKGGDAVEKGQKRGQAEL